MKFVTSKNISLILMVLVSLQSTAQIKMSASKIMDDIKDGRDITYSKMTIVGDLDFTYMNEKDDDLGSHRWWNGDNTVNEDIEVEISFVNCTFEGDVLAYIHVERTGYTFTADFEQEVTFKNCDFKRNAMFKYSEFDREVSFEGSKFNRDNSFKYAEFDERANFANTMFDDDANFKYAKFDEGVSFNGAEFRESLNIKYLEVRGNFDIDGMEVADDIDDKYTVINGDSFVKFLYYSRKN